LYFGTFTFCWERSKGWANCAAQPSKHRWTKSAENNALDNEAPVHHSAPHADLLATYRRAEAEAAHKFGLIQAAAKKGPVAIQKATETATKAAKRRDSYAKKLTALGVDLTD
jgi:mannosyltransferase OCH1-like enzyme